MKIKLPLIGNLATGKDTEPATIVKEVQKYIEKDANLLGGFFEFNSTRLSDEKTISDKLLKANTGWVYRNNDVIAKEVALMELELYSVKIVGGEFEYTKIESHPLLDAIDHFNSSTSLFDGLYTTQSHKKLTGDAFWLLDWRGKELKNIYILTPDKVELELSSPTNKNDILVSAYLYKDVVDGKPVTRKYTPEQVIHFRTPNPNNPFRGYGAVEAAAEVIDTDNLATETMKKFYQNGAIINFILTTEGKVTDEQLKRLRAELRANYAGAGNAYKTMILGGGLKPEPIQPNNKEQEFLAQLEWYRDKIMVIFGNSKASVGIVDDVNRATQESAIVSWRKNSIKPEMTALVNTLNEFLVPKYGENLILTFCDPVGEDRTALIDEVTKLKNAGIIDNNEARNMLDMDTRPDPVNDLVNAEREQQQQAAAQEQAAAALANIDLKKTLRKRGLYQKRHSFRIVKNEAKSVAKQIVDKRKSKKKQVSEEPHILTKKDVALAYYEKQIGIVENVEKLFQDKVEKFIGKVVNKAIEQVPEEFKDLQNKALIDDKEDLIIEAVLDFSPLLEDLATKSGQLAMDLVDDTKPYVETDLTPGIKKRIEHFAKSLIDTDNQVMVDILTQGMQSGESVSQITGHIREVFDGDYTKNQATRITRTEVLRMSNLSAIDAWKQSGVVVGKEWLTAPGADAECEQYNGKIQYLDGNFFKGDQWTNGDPPIHPNCRCTLIPVLEGEQKSVFASNKLKPKDNTKQELQEAKEYIKELEDFVNG